MQKGIVVKFVGGVATVWNKDGVFSCLLRKKLRENGVFVGDKVSFSHDKTSDTYAIELVAERTNQLKRPPIVNVDTIVIMISPSPKPDLILVDKLLIKCFWENIEPVLCINKIDKAEKAFIDDIKQQYANVVKVIEVSAITGSGVSEFRSVLKNKFTAMAGQSAVGKSTLLNALAPEVNAETGELSKKTERGRHTTRFNKIYLLGDGIMLADTPGFTMLELDDDIESSVLEGLYPDFKRLGVCKFRNCNHIDTDVKLCVVKAAVQSGQLSAERYARYAEIYKETKKREDKKYG